MPEGKILVIEDDDALGNVLAEALSSHGFEVRLVASGADALSEVKNRDPDLALVDLGLPDIDGEQLCRTIRTISGCVIVVLTARREEIDLVLALEAGADDYLSKPVRLRELLARIRAHLRRRHGIPGTTEYSVGNLSLKCSTRQIVVADVEIALRPKEFDLLALLVSRQDQVVAREEIMEEVWDAKWYESSKTLDMHISSLRRKLAGADWDGEIATLRGVGFRIKSP